MSNIINSNKKSAVVARTAVRSDAEEAQKSNPVELKTTANPHVEIPQNVNVTSLRQWNMISALIDAPSLDLPVSPPRGQKIATSSVHTVQTPSMPAYSNDTDLRGPEEAVLENVVKTQVDALVIRYVKFARSLGLYKEKIDFVRYQTLILELTPILKDLVSEINLLIPAESIQPQSGIFDAMRSAPEIKQLLSVVVETIDKSTMSMDDINTLLKNVTNFFSPEAPPYQALMKNAEVYADAGQKASDTFGKLGDYVTQIPVYLCFLAVVSMAITKPTALWISLSCALGLYITTLFPYIREKMSEVFKYLTALNDTSEGAVPNAAGAIPLIKPLIAMMSSFFVHMFDYNYSVSRSFTNFVSTTVLVDRLFSDSGSVWAFFTETFTSMLNWFKHKVCGLDYDLVYQTHITPIEDWYDEIEKIRALTSAEFPINYKNSLILLRLQATGYSFRKEATYQYVKGTTHFQLINTYMVTLEKMLAPFRVCNLAGGGPRMEPVSVLFSGYTGVGKSQMIFPLINTMATRLFGKNLGRANGVSYNDFVFNRVPANNYWDGYVCQPFVTLDDFGQSRDSPGQVDNEYLDFIRMANSFPYDLHMADISQKGNTPFMGQIIVATTNMYHLKSESIRCVDAVARRFIHFDIRIKEEYAKNTHLDSYFWSLDTDKVGGQAFNKDVYDITMMDWQRKPLRAQMSFDEVTDFIINEYEHKVSKFEKYSDYLNSIIEQAPHIPKPYEMFPHQADMSNINARSQGGADVASGSDEVMIMSVEEWEKEWSDRNRYSTSIPSLADFANLEFSCTPSTERLPLEGLATAVDALEDLNCLPFPYTPNGVYEWLKKDVLGVECDAALTQADTELIYNYITMVVKRSPDPVIKPLEEGFSRRGSICNSYVKKTQRCFANHPKAALVGFLASAIGVASLVFTLGYKWYTRTDKEPEAYTDSNTVRRSKKMKSVINRVKAEKGMVENIQSQGGHDVNAFEVCEKIRNKNSLDLYLILDDNEPYPLGKALFVKEDYGIIPNHFTRIIEDKAVGYEEISLAFELVAKSGEVTNFIHVKMDEIEFVDTTSMLSSDLVMFRIPSLKFAFKDITKNFLSRKQFDIFQSMPMRVTVLLDVNTNTEAKYRGHLPVTPISGDKYFVEHTCEYRAYTRVGDCGAAIVVDNPSFVPGKILGVHVAGDTGRGYGYGAILTQDDLQACMDLGIHAQGGSMLDSYAGHKVIGTVPKTFRPYNSCIRRSELYEEWGYALKSPAMLRPVLVEGVNVDPMEIALLNYAGEPLPVNEKKLDTATCYLAAKILDGKNSSFNRVLTNEEAILGVEGVKYADPMTRNTSPGWPYVLNNPGEGKKAWFGSGDKYDITGDKCKEFLADVALKEKELLAGRSVDFYFMGFLKDELVSRKKAAELKTRYIAGAPMDQTFLIRKYFLAFNAHMMKNQIINGSAIGIDVHSRAWDVLARMLKSKGSRTGAGDFKKFDSKQFAQIMISILDNVIQPFYNDEFYVVRRLLLESVCYSKHLVMGLILQWLKSLPSGCELTSVLNTLYQMVLFILCWIDLHPEHDVSGYYDHIYAVMYGDDNNFNMSDWASEFFNEVTLVDAMAQYGMTYTTDLKSDSVNTVPYRKLEEITFLKRAYRYEPILGRVVAPLSLATILEMPYWTQAGLFRDEITRDKVETALQELSYHGKETFDQYSSQIIPVVDKKLGYYVQNRNFERCIRKIEDN